MHENGNHGKAKLKDSCDYSETSLLAYVKDGRNYLTIQTKLKKYVSSG